MKKILIITPLLFMFYMVSALAETGCNVGIYSGNRSTEKDVAATEPVLRPTGTGVKGK